jgi:hypothetical protein
MIDLDELVDDCQEQIAKYPDLAGHITELIRSADVVRLALKEKYDKRKCNALAKINEAIALLDNVYDEEVIENLERAVYALSQ